MVDFAKEDRMTQSLIVIEVRISKIVYIIHSVTGYIDCCWYIQGEST
jgi:hypothetical protein